MLQDLYSKNLPWKLLIDEINQDLLISRLDLQILSLLLDIIYEKS